MKAPANTLSMSMGSSGNRALLTPMVSTRAAISAGGECVETEYFGHEVLPPKVVPSTRRSGGIGICDESLQASSLQRRASASGHIS